jgi:hypothetical protein
MMLPLNIDMCSLFRNNSQHVLRYLKLVEVVKLGKLSVSQSSGTILLRLVKRLKLEERRRTRVAKCLQIMELLRHRDKSHDELQVSAPV